MIIFDMEWNSGRYERVVLNEILQIGAVRLERLGGPAVDTFNIYIRPQVHKRWSPPAEELLALDECRNSPWDFPAAAQIFFRWCGEGARFAAWGTADFAVLLENLRYWHIDPPPLAPYYDLQEAFALTAGAKRQPALHHAVEYCRLPETLDYHNAQNDAFYTALVSGFVDETVLPEVLRDPYQASKRRKKKTARLPDLKDKSLGQPRWQGLRQGPFTERDRLLNNRGCRLAVCPVCGQKTRVGSWLPGEGGDYFAKFSCPGHGTYIARLVSAEDRDGRVWAAAQVLDLADKARAAYDKARKRPAFSCASGGAPRKKGKRCRRIRKKAPSSGK